MVKRRCPNCNELMFSAMENEPWECKCGTVLGPELNMGVEETEINQAVFPKVGDILGGDYQVLAVHKKEYALGFNKSAAEPYVTWYLDQYGNTYGGEYFKTSYDAERRFAALCYKWFDDSDELGKAISIYNQLKWSRNIFTLGYDHENGVILFNESRLMNMIMMANPAQESRPIRLVSLEELKEYCRLKKRPNENGTCAVYKLETSRFYFTFDTDEQYPYQCGWVEIVAFSMASAIEKFKARFGVNAERYPGVINCADMYTERQFKETEMYEGGNLGKYCHEIIM